MIPFAVFPGLGWLALSASVERGWWAVNWKPNAASHFLVFAFSGGFFFFFLIGPILGEALRDGPELGDSPRFRPVWKWVVIHMMCIFYVIIPWIMIFVRFVSRKCAQATGESTNDGTEPFGSGAP
ncbi:hypothetical protein P3T73_07300 [Kiritimatiellota bacterium B12222]|nr:hypothetical protein P3T73_07300 [Kiritimatiellota bacterium B12222]